MENLNILFLPDNIKKQFPKGTNILEACLTVGIFLNSACGGEGVCGRCKVIIKEGKIKSEGSGLISKEELEKGYALGCRSSIESDLVIQVPEESRLTFTKTQTTDIEIVPAKKRALANEPLLKKIFLDLKNNLSPDISSDVELILSAIKKAVKCENIEISISEIQELPSLLRDSDWKITATLFFDKANVKIVKLQPGDTTPNNFALAFDIGTTTVSGQLINLICGDVLSTRASYNSQAAYGADVITRIMFTKEPNGLEILHKTVTNDINSIIQDLISQNNISVRDIDIITCAGNTTMIQLLLKINASFIRLAPYKPSADFVPSLKACEFNIHIDQRARLVTFPNVSAYIGGDTICGVLSVGLDEQSDISMLIDIGTNGEIVLGNSQWMVSCAASAGPAFEGSGITCGMRASAGAISKIVIAEDGNVNYSTIDSKEPIGICGSGLIDLVSELLRRGIITKDGKFDTNIKNNRLRLDKQPREFVVEFKKPKDIVITEDDIENLKRSKAAIYSAIISLLNKVEIKLDDVKKIYIAGGFGTYLNMEKAISIGLLPHIDRERYHFVGNSSLSGARESLLSIQSFNKTLEIAKKITYIDLSSEPIYMHEYIAALFFPHTDISKFKSAKAGS